MSIDGKTRPMVHNMHEWFTLRKSKQNRIKSNSKITNPITLSNRFSTLLESIDDLVQSQTIQILLIHQVAPSYISREPDGTTTLVGNKSGSLDDTIHTEDTDNTGAPHIDKYSSANYLYYSFSDNQFSIFL